MSFESPEQSDQDPLEQFQNERMNAMRSYLDDELQKLREQLKGAISDVIETKIQEIRRFIEDSNEKAAKNFELRTSEIEARMNDAKPFIRQLQERELKAEKDAFEMTLEASKNALDSFIASVKR
ncbi:hypothetical protein KGP36_05080 [Patescibacteria group bacterium]|nr:hypothetical protein [Patescibacteria group bacterium]